MHRIDGAGHDNGQWVAEDPATSRPPTEITADWMNAIQEEIAAVVEAHGPLVKAENNQLLTALQALFAPTGSVATILGIQRQVYTAFTTTGTAAAFVIDPDPAPAAYVSGFRLRVAFHTAGSAGCSINVSALGAKLLKQYNSAGAKVPAVIATGQLADVEYDGTHFVVLNALPAAVNTDALLDVAQVLPGAAHVLALTDRGASVDTSAAVTVPANATVAFPIGSTVSLTNISNAGIAVTPAGGVTLRRAGTTQTGVRTLAAYGMATLRKVAADEWYITGAGVQ